MKNKNINNLLFLLLKLDIISILVFNFFDLNDIKKKLFKKRSNSLQIDSLKELFNSNINKNNVLIFEPFNYHYECTPGYSKYFIELGYNVDIIMNKDGITSLCLFEPTEKIRVFTYANLNDILESVELLIYYIKNYKCVLVETTEPKILKLYQNLNLLNINHSLFVFHHLNYSYFPPFNKKLNKNKIFCLGNFSNALQVNPHYFGDIKLKKKNKITRFFITSTRNRNYKYLVTAAEKMKEKNFNFQVIVVGKWWAFCKKDISDNLKDNFVFKHKILYSKLYKEVSMSDYIIINLDPDNIYDDEYKNIRVTGSAQLAYGFLKPVIINKDFSSIYSFNSENSLIYENSNFTETMIAAVNINYHQYKTLQKNLKHTANVIFEYSLKNTKKAMNNL